MPPTRSAEIWEMSALQLVEAIRIRELSSVEVVEAGLARIDAVNPKVNAYCTVAADLALESARLAERQVLEGEPLGPLHGVPISFKDMTATAGIRSTWGSRLLEHNVPDQDGLLVRRAKEAGAIVIGKTNTPEFGCKAVTDNPIFGTTRNPWNLAMVSGGSSGGAAAAVACGLGPLAEGSDLGGSIRIPAALCGVVGLKPSARRLGNDDPFVVSPASDGPLARTVRDAALLLDVFVGSGFDDPMALPRPKRSFLEECDEPLGRLRVAWSSDLGYAAVDREVAEIAGRAARALYELGVEVEEASPGFEDPLDLLLGFAGLLYASALGQTPPAAREQLDPEILRLIDSGARLSALDYFRLGKLRAELWQTVSAFFERYDLLLTPTTSLAAFPIADPYPPREVAGRPHSTQFSWVPFAFPFNLTGHPAISVPAGFTSEGLPVGLQIVGRQNDEATVLRAAAAFEAIRPWADRWPDLQ